MSDIIYYVGARVSDNSKHLLWRAGANRNPLHATLVYSRKWFEYKYPKFYPLVLEPPFEPDIFLDQHVIKFKNYRFFNRHIELRNLGATSDHDHFQSHITIGRKLEFEIKDPITLDLEYYGTWIERKK